jgi:hypothetical protein
MSGPTLCPANLSALAVDVECCCIFDQYFWRKSAKDDTLIKHQHFVLIITFITLEINEVHFYKKKKKKIKHNALSK